jgi:hypothetical protein
MGARITIKNSDHPDHLALDRVEGITQFALGNPPAGRGQDQQAKHTPGDDQAQEQPSFRRPEAEVQRQKSLAGLAAGPGHGRSMSNSPFSRVMDSSASV